MITEGFWTSWLAFWMLSGAPGLIGVAAIAHSLHLSRRHLGAIKEALKNSHYIYIWGPSLGRRGFIWSILEISKITGMIVWPKPSIRTGELDPLDLKNFPPHLKWYLIVNLTMMSIPLVWLTAVAFLLKYR